MFAICCPVFWGRPGGRRIAVTVTTVVEDKDKRHSEIWLVPADGSAEALRYTSPVAEASDPVWSPDGALLAFTSRREGSQDAVWFLRTGAPGGEAFQIPGVKALPAFSPDGQWLLFTWRDDSLKDEPWRNRVSPAAITRGADPKRFDGRLYTTLPFKGDERGYLEPREARRPSHLYLVPRSGGEPRALTAGDLDQTAPAWSPDGRIEDLNLKRELFKKLIPFLKEGTVISSNTSGISIQKMCEGSQETSRRGSWELISLIPQGI